MLYILQTALELGFLYALIPMALFLSFRILNIADMTTDGCFVLGTAVSVTMAAAGHPFLGIPAAMLAGVCAGFVTAFLQTRLGVPSILAGIVTNMGLYTINLMVMGWSANVSLLRDDTIFSLFEETGIGGAWHEALLAGMVTVLAGILLVLFLGTRLGLSIRATGDNIDMVRASSINPTFTITVGLCVANSLTALSGAVIKGAIAAVIGSVIYRFIYAIVLYTKIMPVQGLRLATAVIVALAIAFPTIKSWAAFQKRKMAARQKGGR